MCDGFDGDNDLLNEGRDEIIDEPMSEVDEILQWYARFFGPDTEEDEAEDQDFDQQYHDEVNADEEYRDWLDRMEDQHLDGMYEE